MGWFSAKKKTYVSSTTYNLAGDEKVRFLPTAVFSNIITGSRDSISATVTGSLLKGPGIRMRSFARWARTQGYSDAVGLTGATLHLGDSIDNVLLANILPHDPEELVSIQDSFIDGADYAAWADRWLLENHPEELTDDFEIDFSELLNTIYFRRDGLLLYSFSPVGFNPASRYLYANYTLSRDGDLQPVEPGPVTVVSSPAQYLNISDWNLITSSSVSNSVSVTDTETTELSYSDARPTTASTASTSLTLAHTSTEVSYEKTAYIGRNPSSNSTEFVKSFLANRKGYSIVPTTTTVTTTETIEGGVVKTTVVTTVTHALENLFSYQLDTQLIVDTIWSNNQVFIYEYNTGNPTLDAMFATNQGFADFLPFIPVRVNNRTLSPSYKGSLYSKNLKAYTRATGAKYPDLVESVMDNDSIDDIDFVYVVFGVALNTKDKSALKYIFTFFEEILRQGGGNTGFDAWQASWNIADISNHTWGSWIEAQSEPSSPLYGTTEPVRLPYPAAPTRSISLIGRDLNYNIKISWSSLKSESYSGLGKPGAKQGDIWWSTTDYLGLVQLLFNRGEVVPIPISFDGQKLIWQDTPDSYKLIHLQGLQHNNMIWDGKSVNTSGTAALADLDIASFIIPMQEGILRKLSLAHSTQMATDNSYLVFNTYQVVKQKWYQTTWFKIILVIIIIIITIFTFGAGAPAGAGILGTAASVGAALGLTGAIAIVVGTLVNALAAMLITHLLTRLATALFGPEVGAIVGAIASVAVISVGTSYMGGQGLAAGFSNLASAENLMKLSVAAGNGMSEYLGAKTTNTIKETQQALADYETQSKMISDAYEENLGASSVSLDPILLTDSSKWAYIPESSEVFLNRTLLVGSDIALMTHELLANFTKITISTEL
jgi:hypothetical protein